ncbi:L7Ae/L30e/S12e/Gadd45 family ribosomal protein [Flavonifractor plautii]|uniref:L7Ae/L30e/S12e/Gadd45 family ribosomal protein n=1 Tax=Flavonifractor plautii TaxID=292800 RepID=UPI001D00D16E|nr:50S ribosomal protein L7 [Flavonifractor plautii]MCB5375697.1 50S ribosomal protein L7 [Flavonifractor plautii]
MDNVLHLLGIARKAGRVEVGEEPVGASARARQARLILVASDAADNSARRAAHFAQAGKAPWFRVPYTKGELGGTVGRASCAMLALTDVGLAAALLARLAAGAPETYGAAAAELSEKADKALQRQKEQRRHEKKLQKGGRKPWAAPPARKESPPEPAGKRTLPRGRLTVKKKTP